MNHLKMDEMTEEYYEQLFDVPSYRIIKTSERIAHEKPGKDIIEPLFEDLRLDKCVGTYMESKTATQKHKILPKFDNVNFSSIRKVNEALRQRQLAEKVLKEKTKALRKSQAEKQKLVEELIKAQLELRKTHVDYEELVVSDVYKRRRCTELLENVEDQINEKRDEVDQLTKNTEKLEYVRDSLRKNIEKYKMFDDYLSSFLSNESKYRSIDEVVKRYDELSGVRQVVVNEQVETIVATDDVRNAKVRFMELADSLMIGYENTVTKLEEKYKHSRRVASYWERMKFNVQSGCLKQMSAMERVVQCGYSIYEDICSRMNQPPAFPVSERRRFFQHLKELLLWYSDFVETAEDMYDNELASTSDESEESINLDAVKEEKKEVQGNVDFNDEKIENGLSEL